MVWMLDVKEFQSLIVRGTNENLKQLVLVWYWINEFCDCERWV